MKTLNYKFLSYTNLQIFIEELQRAGIKHHFYNFVVYFSEDDKEKVEKIYQNNVAPLEKIAERYVEKRNSLKDRIKVLSDLKESDIDAVLGEFDYEGDEDNVARHLKFLINTEFPYGYKSVPDPLTLYRILCVENEDKINKTELGPHWVADTETIDGRFINSVGLEDCDDSKLYIVMASVPRDNIHAIETIRANMLFPWENEFLLKSNSGIKIEKIFKYTDLFLTESYKKRLKELSGII